MVKVKYFRDVHFNEHNRKNCWHMQKMAFDKKQSTNGNREKRQRKNIMTKATLSAI